MNSTSFLFDIVLTKLEIHKINIANTRKLTAKIKFCNKEINLKNSRINVSDFKPGSAVELQTSPAKLREQLKNSTMSICVQYEDLLLGKSKIKFSQWFIDHIEQGMSKINDSQVANIVLGSIVVGSLELLYQLSVNDKSVPMSTIEESEKDLEINQNAVFLLGDSQVVPCPWQSEASESNDRVRLDIEKLNFHRHDDSRMFSNNNYKNSAVTELKEFLQECTDVIDSINASPSCRNARKHRSCPDSRTEGILPSPAAQGRSNTPCAATGDSSMPQSWNQPTTNCVSSTIKSTRFCPNCLYNMSWLPKFAACPKCHIKVVPAYEEPVRNAEPTFEQILEDYLGKQRPRSQEVAGGPHRLCGEAPEQQPKDARCRCTSERKLCAHCRIRKMCNDINKPSEDRKVQSQPDNLEAVLDAVDSRPHLTRVFSDMRDLYRFKTRKEVPMSHIRCLPKKQSQNRKTADAQPPTVPSTAKRRFQVKPAKKQPKVGHKSCASRQPHVPRHHGWAWASSYEARNHGWRPGAILKPIRKLMNFFLYYLPAQIAQDELESSQKPDSPPPILHVSKKAGDTFITYRPRNSCSAQTVPVVFRVVKSGYAMVLSSIKKSLKARGFRKCTCHKPIMLCDCRSQREKKRLEDVLSKECRYRGMESCVNDLVLTDTSDSEAEFDIDVTPPKANTGPRMAPKTLTCDNGTQFYGNQWQPIHPNPPIKQSPCWRAFDCVAGDRYRGTAFGKPEEEVFEDEIFGYGGGGPHDAAPLAAYKHINIDIWSDNGSGGPMRNVKRCGGGRSSAGMDELHALKKRSAALHQPKRPRARRIVSYCR